MIQSADRLAAAIACLLLAACSSAPPKPKSTPNQNPAASTAQEAVANLASASGSLVSGKLILKPMGDGVHVSGDVGGFRPGDVRGLHIHEQGDCSAVDASSAGADFNPGAQPHGRARQGAQHAVGSNNNIVADARGVARVNAHVRGVRLGGGAANDIAGRAIIVHAAADDHATQPGGNAGARVACGVIRVVR